MTPSSVKKSLTVTGKPNTLFRCCSTLLRSNASWAPDITRYNWSDILYVMDLFFATFPLYAILKMNVDKTYVLSIYVLLSGGKLWIVSAFKRVINICWYILLNFPSRGSGWLWQPPLIYFYESTTYETLFLLFILCLFLFS